MKELLQFLRWPVVCGLLAAIIILDHFPNLLGLNNHPGSGQSQQITAPPGSQGPYSYSQAVKQAAPAVVNIYTSKRVTQELPPKYRDPFFRYFLQKNNIRQKERVERSLGSGIIINPNGYILTNNHVIKDADEILVLLQDGREALASVIGTDPETDLAVLKISLNNLETITIGDPSQAMVGDVVLAIGNPYGFGHTVTQGIISATGRYGLRLTTYENFIQTDAAINPGNSGGALVDAQGHLLGINTAIQSNSGGSQGIGLATPSDLALRIMSDLIQYGKVIRGWLGIEVQAVPGTIAESYNLPFNNGVIITGTYRDGPADDSGLMGGDIITSINGQPVGDGHAGMNLIAATRPGEEVAIEIVREGQTMNVNAVVGSRPNSRE
ncbi:trypsin-like peptidase domain-containing protein [Oceanicoccus sagamiensis]|uniref:2-alkenal reductase n=1 Tax=Oceanicoccus sagamiensis TaxID=716816 RepID=A0A1X9NM05_9GAMM|nr:trypsin-like peptidase domain-containing protein [Oceanicoccus sagamiensis]ARN76399.1 2-alkenal reductase [Oceanicoccus sagamiensis]